MSTKRRRELTGISNQDLLILVPDTKRKIYNAMVLPHLDYCSVMWQECTKEVGMKLERVQNYGMRIILS